MRTLTSSFSGGESHNPNVWLTTKARAYKSAGQEGSLGGTSYTPENVGECERMNSHTPK
jgi:hypothetical protein